MINFKRIATVLIFVIAIINNIYGQEKIRVEVKNGAVIISGRYIQPPYTIEARENGIWINEILAERIVKRKENNKRIREERIRSEIYADYFELSEEMNSDKAREKIKEDIMRRGKVREFEVINAKFKDPTKLEINLDSGENFNIELSSNPTKYEKQHMFNCLLSKKYKEWYKATGRDKSKAYNNLVKILEKQQSKRFIKEYSIEDDTWRIKYSNGISGFSVWPPSVREKEILSDNEADRLDKEDLQRRIETFRKSLNGDYLEVFSKGLHVYAGPNGESTISELEKIIADKNISLEQRREKIKKVYRPAEIEEKFLQEILDNFNK